MNIGIIKVQVLEKYYEMFPASSKIPRYFNPLGKSKEVFNIGLHLAYVYIKLSCPIPPSAWIQLLYFARKG